MTATTEHLESLLEATIQAGASDLILHLERQPSVRVAGKIIKVESPVVTPDLLEHITKLSHSEKGALDSDGAISSQGGSRFRVNQFRSLGTVGMVLRYVQDEVPMMESLGLPISQLRSWCQFRSGLILVCGPAGSGKSTTLAASINWLANEKALHVITIEDPVEFRFTDHNSVFTQREVGIDTASFSHGLRQALRQSPDVILVGEIRDGETARTALQAAETGHLVMATLHSGSAAESIERLQRFYEPTAWEAARKTLADCLRGVLFQRLLEGTDGKLVAATEFFSTVGAPRLLIEDGNLADLQDLISTDGSPEVCSLETSLFRLVQVGRLSQEEAVGSSSRPEDLKRRLSGVSSSSTRR